MKRIIALLTMAAGLILGLNGCASATTTATPITVTRDLHDGIVVQNGSTYYLYGTHYSCGFSWGTKNSNFCGFGSAKGASLTSFGAGNVLFSVTAKVNSNWKTDNGMTWQKGVCGNGVGCFNARMLHTPAGKWVLWFNAPGDKGRNGNPYWAMTCSGPQGPCGSPHKPAIYGPCSRGGDFSIASQAGAAWLFCAGNNRSVGAEKLSANWMDGTKTYINTIAPGPAEGVGVYHDSSGYTLTYSGPNCGYCSGPPADESAAPGAKSVQLGTATATNLAGPWTNRGNAGPQCIGQPRSDFGAGGSPYLYEDHWTGAHNEAAATIRLIPMPSGACNS
jgi:hypothetical protein